MSPDLTQLMAGGALALIIIDKVFALIKPLLHKPSQHITEAAGAQNKNWWIVTIRQLNKEENLPLIELMMRVERNQVEILRILGSVRLDQKRRNRDED